MKSIWTALALLAYSVNAYSNEFRYENFPVGDTPSALAGAYTAQSGNAFSMHYNPAGIAGIEKQVSGTLNAFTSSTTKYKEVFPVPVGIEFTIDGIENDYRFDSLERSSNTIIPGFLGYVTQIGKLSVGGYLATPDISYEQLSDTNTFNFFGSMEIYPGDSATLVNEFGTVIEQRSLSVDSEYNVTQAGISAALPLTSNLSVGSTIGFIQVKKKEIFITSEALIEASDESDYNYRQFATEGIRTNDEKMLIEPKLGLLWKADDLALGVDISQKINLSRNLNYNGTFLETYSEQSIDHSVDPATSYDSTLTLIQVESEEKQSYPIALKLGTVKSFDWGYLSLDIHHYTAVDDTPVLENNQLETSFDSAIYVDATRTFEQVTNYSLAANVNISSNTNLFFGAFTDFSNTTLNTFDENADVIAYLPHEDIDMYGISFAVNHKTEDFNATTGIIASSGSGKAASWELIAFGGGHDEGVNDYFEVDKTNINIFFGIQY